MYGMCVVLRMQAEKKKERLRGEVKAACNPWVHDGLYHLAKKRIVWAWFGTQPN